MNHRAASTLQSPLSLNRLITLANPLLHLVEKAQTPRQVHFQLRQQIPAFESKALAYHPAETVRTMSYLLCCTLDARLAHRLGDLGNNTLVTHLFHFTPEQAAARRAMMIQTLLETPTATREVLEFAHLCLALLLRSTQATAEETTRINQLYARLQEIEAQHLQPILPSTTSYRQHTTVHHRSAASVTLSILLPTVICMGIGGVLYHQISTDAIQQIQQSIIPS